MIKEKIKSDLINVLKAKNTFVVGILRFLLAEIQNEEIDKKRQLDDDELVSLLQGRVKESKKAIELFEKGDRKDLAEKEQKEIEIINKYLPS